MISDAEMISSPLLPVLGYSLYTTAWAIGDTTQIGYDCRDSSLDFDGSESLVIALRGELPLRTRVTWKDDGLDFHGRAPPSLRKAELSTWSMPKSYPTVGSRRHGIFLHQRRIHTSEFIFTVSLSRLFYVIYFVYQHLLTTFIDPPWLLLSNHPAKFALRFVLVLRTYVMLHKLIGGTSAFKNCVSWPMPSARGSLLQSLLQLLILPLLVMILLRQSSACLHERLRPIWLLLSATCSGGASVRQGGMLSSLLGVLANHGWPTFDCHG